MNKIAISCIILLIAIVLFIVDIVLGMKTSPVWWAGLDEAIVTCGIFEWHMGIIRSYYQKVSK